MSKLPTTPLNSAIEHTEKNKNKKNKNKILPTVILTGASIFNIACWGDDPVTPPTPPIKKGTNDAPSLNMADTLRFDLKNKPTTADFNTELLKWVSDDHTPDNKLTITTQPAPDLSKIGTTNIKVTVTDDGTDSQGKMGTKKSSSKNTVVKVTDGTEVIAHFPEVLGWSDNNTITAGDSEFFSNLFNQEISITRGEETTKVKPFKITVNWLEVDATHRINQEGTFEIESFVKNSQGEVLSKKYTIVVEYGDIETENLNKYKEIQFPDLIMPNGRELTPRIQAMGIPWLQKILEHNIIAPSDKTTTVLEIGEGSQHIFWDYMKKIIGNIGNIQYKLLSLKDYWWDSDDANFRQKLKEKITEYTQNGNFLLTEINESARWDSDYAGSTNFWNTFKNNNQVFTSFAEGGLWEYEKLAQQGYGKVSLPGFRAENGKRYLYLNRSWTDSESNPFINSIDEPLYVGIDFWSSSGASAANAATWALGTDLLHRLGHSVDRNFWNTIFTDPKYDACFEPAYRIDTDGKLWEKNKEYEKGRVLIWDNFVNIFQTFALNTTEIQSLQKGQRVPLMKYWEILDHNSLHIAEKKGIVSEEKNGKVVFYIDYNLLAEQIGEDNVPQFLADPHYEYLIGDEDTKTRYWKP